MSAIENTGFYIGTHKCGCTTRVIVDASDLQKEITTFMKECVKDGMTVNHVNSMDDIKLKTCKCDPKHGKTP